MYNKKHYKIYLKKCASGYDMVDGVDEFITDDYNKVIDYINEEYGIENVRKIKEDKAF